MTDNCYWHKSLKGKNGAEEGNRVRKYRDYYFENPDMTLQELADHFNISSSTMEKHSSNYQWDKVIKDITAYESKKIQEERIQEKKEILSKNEVPQLKLLFETINVTHHNYKKMAEQDEEQVVVGHELKTRKIRPAQKITSDKEHLEGLKTAFELAYLIVNSGTTKTENKNENTHTIKSDGIDYFKDKPEYENIEEFTVNDFIIDDADVG